MYMKIYGIIEKKLDSGRKWWYELDLKMNNWQSKMKK